ncbi:MAG TPA: hypothetical protein DCL44_06405 [Elusimicrobia bacterium]|nr:hypothetical protein [Elusimicrobiota bacterium]
MSDMLRKIMGLPVLLLLSSVPAWCGMVDKIVVFKEPVAFGRIHSSITRGGGEITKELDIINAVVARFPSEESAALALSRMPGVELVENDDYLYRLFADDEMPGLPSLENFIIKADEVVVKFSTSRPVKQPVSTQKLPWDIRRMGARAAWQQVTGRGVKVCVLDTGIDTDHPDLLPNYAAGSNFVNPGTPPEDDKGHGTHVSGTIAAADNRFGLIGMAPDASLYEAKVLDSSGSGKTSWLIDGLAWCKMNGASVANMSLGNTQVSEALHKAIQAVYDGGMTLVASSGNDPKAPVHYPAAYPEVIAVSASAPGISDSSGTIITPESLAAFSSIGPEVDMIAPGQRIYSTARGGAYIMMSGTSMAAPHVAGAAALAVSLGYVTPVEIRRALELAAVKLPGLTEEQQGFGMINAGNIPIKR